MRWRLANKSDPTALRVASRHYNVQTPGRRQLMPPGRTLVLVTTCGRAVWGTSAQDPAFVDHAWPGAFVCSIFRNEGAGRSSELITEAVAAVRHAWGCPAAGMISFVDEAKIRSTNPGYCFRMAGFERLAERTRERNLVVLRLPPERWPDPEAPIGWQHRLVFA